MRYFIILLLICAVILGGCDMTNRSYTVITPHLLEAPDTTEGVNERVENYSGLKNAILHLVEQGLESGVIRLYSYPGNAIEDIKTACRETMLDEPLGAYAVEYVGYDTRKILAYYEAAISITYRRTPEQIAAVQELSATEFREAVADLYVSGGTGLVAYLSYYYDDPRYDPADIIREVHYDMPLDGYAIPEISVTLYPESGWRRIVELSLDFGEVGGAAEIAAVSRSLRSAAAAMAAEHSREEMGDAAALRSLAKTMSDAAEYVYPDASPYADTAYGFFLEGAASDEGFALALKGMLDFQGIESVVVFGRYNGAPRVWNLVKINDGYYHVDVPLGSDFVLKTDAEMFITHEYSNPSSYPAADGPAIQTTAEAPDTIKEV